MTERYEADRVELTVDVVAPGGHCVARLDGQVVFVRHALPGERVVAEITEVHRGYLRADAVEILAAAPERVTPPCPYAGPNRCGGCDLQHVAPDAQREWKETVVREQLRRLGGLSADEVDQLGVRVEALPGGMTGWRSRVRYAVDAAGRAGLLKHRSHEVVPVDRCLIAHPAIQELPVLAASGRRWPAADAVEVVASSGGDVVVSEITAGLAGFGDLLGGGGDFGDAAGAGGGGPRGAGGGSREVGAGPRRVDVGDEVLVDAETALVRELAAGREWMLPAEAFWQVHPAAADTLVAAVLELLKPVAGESAWDLYGGAGLFAGALAERVGPTGRVTLVEAAALGVSAARDNLRDLPGVEVVSAKVETALARRRVIGPVDLVVLDPPRTGAGGPVARAVAASGARAVAYVACDPAAFARDVRTFREAGWRLTGLRGYDLFPMTQHVELVGLFLPS